MPDQEIVMTKTRPTKPGNYLAVVQISLGMVMVEVVEIVPGYLGFTVNSEPVRVTDFWAWCGPLNIVTDAPQPLKE